MQKASKTKVFSSRDFLGWYVGFVSCFNAQHWWH